MTTDMYVIWLSQGESVSGDLERILDPVDMASIGHFTVSKAQPTELHYHDYDEYWYFIEGTTTVMLRTPDGASKSYWIGPGDLIVTPKGVEHRHLPDDAVKGVQWVSVIEPNARRGHLHRE